MAMEYISPYIIIIRTGVRFVKRNSGIISNFVNFVYQAEIIYVDIY